MFSIASHFAHITQILFAVTLALK